MKTIWVVLIQGLDHVDTVGGFDWNEDASEFAEQLEQEIKTKFPETEMFVQVDSVEYFQTINKARDYEFFIK